jgi:hypothetical protein
MYCIGTVYVQCKKLAEIVDSHVVVRYDMKRNISTAYGNDTYTDCRSSEMEAAEEHVYGELAYNWKREIVIGYDLQDDGEINQKAKVIVKQIIDEYLENTGVVDIQAKELGRKPNFPHDKPVVIRSPSAKDGFFMWAWNFTADEMEYGCTLKCQGSVNITLRQSKIPNTKKRQRQRATRALPRAQIMQTHILHI